MPPRKPRKKQKDTERTKEITILAKTEDDAINPEGAFFSMPGSQEAKDSKNIISAPVLPKLVKKETASVKAPTLENSYQLNIEVPVTPDEQYVQKTEVKSAPQLGKKIGNKAWHFLEWITTSALFFAVIFFVINYSSYADLLKFKVNELRGITNSNPVLEKLLPSAEPVTQQLLPIAQNPQASKKQLPPLDFDIAPPDDRVIIPRIGQNIPIVKVSSENLIKKDWGGLEKDIQAALQDGVVHYPGTAEPGMSGNVVITGHSSYFPWDPGRFKDVFSLLHKVSIGDIVIVYHNQKAYNYKVYDKKEVNPDQVDVLVSQGESRLTLITCTPVGTNLRRLIVLAKPM